MFQEAELKIFEQFDYELNQPTAVDLLIQFIHLDFERLEKSDEKDKPVKVFRRLPTKDLEDLLSHSIEKIYQANF